MNERSMLGLDLLAIKVDQCGLDVSTRSAPIMTRPMFFAAALSLACGSGWAADLHRETSRGAVALFSPAAPIGVASEFPRSPLADAFVNGDVRFESETEARARCPNGPVVRVETWVNEYRIVRRSERGGSGAFMCRTDALFEGDHPPAKSR